MAQDIEMGFPSPLSGSKEELEAFLDNLFAEEMARLHLPGAVIALVRDDEICLVKGYGYANLEKGVKADPERSIFRVGSVSKLFTAVAVMQLAEKKLVDLHTDVAAYQDRIKLESRSGRTVTLAHLLTHTGGFDEKYLGISAKERSRTTPLGDYLSTEMPRQVRAPGEYFQYSNHGMALAGYIVEAVSGLSFAEYIDAEILEPLGMQNSGFDLYPDRAPDLAVGYKYSGQGFIPVPFDYIVVAPAAGLSASATDMARFMIAQLNEAGATVLNAASVREMQRQQFSYHRAIPGMAYGFMENYMNGVRVLEHGGDCPGFSSHLMLIPDYDAGLFVSVNSNAAHPLFARLLTEFMDRYFPAGAAVVPSADTPQREARIRSAAGYYRPLRHSRQDFTKLISLFEQVAVAPGDRGQFILRPVLAGSFSSRTFMEIEPFIFEDSARKARAIFLTGDSGDPEYLAVGPHTWQKVGFFESVPFQFALMGIFVLISMVGAVSWIGGLVARALRKKERRHSDKLGLVAKLTGLTSLLILCFFAGSAIAFACMNEFLYGIPPAAYMLLILPFAVSVLTLALTVINGRALAQRLFKSWPAVYYGFINLVFLIFVIFLVYWNFLKLLFQI
ncbi:MAG: serine hydrolase domain-containing protein [Dethiobacteria bacterium]